MYKHLSREERYQIHSLLKAKQTICKIARLPDCWAGAAGSSAANSAVAEASVVIAPSKLAPKRLSEHSKP
jgi:hypothetical protein